jgi:hypothetical protein
MRMVAVSEHGSLQCLMVPTRYARMAHDDASRGDNLVADGAGRACWAASCRCWARAAPLVLVRVWSAVRRRLCWRRG